MLPTAPVIAAAATRAPLPPLCLDGTRYVLTFDGEFATFAPYDPATKRGVWDTSYPWGRTNPGARDAAQYQDANVAAAGGALTLTAARTPQATYTSGLITTLHSFSQTFGYFVARMRLPRGRGLWPAFWMLPVYGYPPEIDVVEVLGQNPGRIYQTTHGVDRAAGRQVVWTASDASDGFHDYGVAWTHESITFYVDGHPSGSVPNVSDQPMYLLANLQVGAPGSWPGAPDATTAFPATMTIDYIRAYASAGTCPSAMDK